LSIAHSAFLCHLNHLFWPGPVACDSAVTSVTVVEVVIDLMSVLDVESFVNTLSLPLLPTGRTLSYE